LPKANTVKCMICGMECNGDSALAHLKLTNHNLWALILPKNKKVKPAVVDKDKELEG